MVIGGGGSSYPGSMFVDSRWSRSGRIRRALCGSVSWTEFCVARMPGKSCKREVLAIGTTTTTTISYMYNHVYIYIYILQVF